MSDAEYYPEEEEVTSPGLPERKPKFDKWMAISWGISLASAVLILALATVIVLFVKQDEEEAPGFALAVDMQLDQEEIEKKVQQILESREWDRSLMGGLGDKVKRLSE